MSKSLSFSAIPVLALPLILMAALIGPIGASPARLRTHREARVSDLQQFATAGHVLGARPDGIVIAGLDHVLRIGFQGANDAFPRSTAAAQGDDARRLESVSWSNLWDGITLTYRAAASGIAESVYTLAPGADVGDIRLSYSSEVVLNDDGSLAIRYETGELIESAPVAWQVIDGRRRTVSVRYRLASAFTTTGTVVGYELSAHDPRVAVVIDPTLAWNLFVGSSADEQATDITVDASGNAYVLGNTTHPWGTPLRAWSGKSDVFVVKLDASGAQVWLTFLGGADQDYSASLVVDAAGAITVAGTSNATWGTALHPHRGDGGGDIFIARLQPNGDLTWTSFIGGGGLDTAVDLAQDGTGNLIAVGETNVAWPFPSTTPFSGADVFVARFGPNDGALIWNTYLGSSGYDLAAGVQIVGSAVYVGGSSFSVWGLPIAGHHGNDDGFLARLNLGSGDVVWNTFIGGPGDDNLNAVIADGSGNLFVAATSSASWGAPVRAYSGSSDVAVARFTSVGVLQWNTFLGNTRPEWANGIALGTGGSLYISHLAGTWGAPLNDGTDSGVARLSQTDGALQWNTFVADAGAGTSSAEAVTTDASGLVYVAGNARTGWGSPVNAHSGGMDAYAARLNGAGTRQWHTFIGTTVNDQVTAIRVNDAGEAFVVGVAGADWGGPLRLYSGLTDALVAKFDPSGQRIWLTFLGGNNYDLGQSLALDGAGNIYVGGYSYSSWGTPVRAFSNGTDAFVARLASDGSLQWHTFLGGLSTDMTLGLVPTPYGVAATGPSLATWGSPLRAYSGGTDGFIAGLGGDGALLWNTFVGGAGNDTVSRLSTVGDGTVHAIGHSSANWGSPVNAFAGGSDVLVASISPAGALNWSTFIGSSGNDYGYGIADDDAGHLFAVGVSAATWGSPQYPHSIGTDGFVARLDGVTGQVQWNTFMGSGGATTAADVAIENSSGTIYVTGYSDGPFGQSWHSYTASADVFLAEFRPTGQLQRTAFFGDAGFDVATALAFEPVSRAVFISGYGDVAWGDSNEALFSYNGGLDGFIARIDLNTRLFLPALSR